MKFRLSGPILAGITVLCLLVTVLTGCDSSRGGLNIGQTAPAFETVDQAGQPVRFPQDYSGRPVVVRFWADWCSVCEPEMRALEPEYQQLRRSGLELLAVNVGQDRETVTAFVTRTGISYPSLLDEKLTIYSRYEVVGLPTTFFVDARGVIRGKAVGELSPRSFARQVAAISKE